MPRVCVNLSDAQLDFLSVLQTFRHTPGSGLPLRLVTAQAVAELPRDSALLSDHVRRPGDRHEVVDLPECLASALEGPTAERGLSLAVASALVIEARWLTARLIESTGLHDSIGRLDALAEADKRVHRRLGAAEADYLRVLMMPRARASTGAPVGRGAIPVRLLGRIDWSLLYDEDLAALLDRSIRWEIAAVLARLTMSEWGFESILRSGGRL